MSSARREGIGSAPRVARTRHGNSPSPSPTASQNTPSAGSRPRRVVGTSSLRSKPTSSIEAPTTFDFFNDPDVLVTSGASYRATAAAFQSVRFLLPAPGGGGTIDPVDGGTPVVPKAYPASPRPDEPAGSALAFHNEDFDWPALRSSPIWLPNFVITGEVVMYRATCPKP
ncbi:hypothetical protein CYMTET_52531 [Cymbomonas tetramitiformis]|uniref:Uncharacterized protein n=1 Tax=Cymbomonas tetramitiformis TaxID=36881 RepID=A0AAE0BJY8_9CHLO|nr:hypothetical protein CYMTET_52531 [Cymbomonas tetramitiformis]